MPISEYLKHTIDIFRSYMVYVDAGILLIFNYVIIRDRGFSKYVTRKNNNNLYCKYIYIHLPLTKSSRLAHKFSLKKDYIRYWLGSSGCILLIWSSTPSTMVIQIRFSWLANLDIINTFWIVLLRMVEKILITENNKSLTMGILLQWI